jgi:hypothetical protein
MQPGQRFVVRLQNQAFVRLQATFFSSIQISLARVRAAVSVLPVGRIYWVGKAQRGVSRTHCVVAMAQRPAGTDGGIFGNIGRPSCTGCHRGAEAVYRCISGMRSELSSNDPSFTGTKGKLAGMLHSGVPHSPQNVRPTSSPLSPLVRNTFASPLVTSKAVVDTKPT